MNTLVINPHPIQAVRHPEDVPWTGVLYGHMMPGLPLIASRLAAQQRRPHQPPAANPVCLPDGSVDRPIPAGPQ